MTEPKVTELDVRLKAQSYGVWFGTGQGLFVGSLVTALVHLAGAPCALGWVTLMAMGLVASVKWRRSWRTYRASYQALYAQERQELNEALAEQKRWLDELQGAVAKATGAEH